MKKYKALVKYKIGMTDHMEFESSAASPKDVTEELQAKLKEDLVGEDSFGFFSSDDVTVEFEIVDVAATKEDE